MQSVYNLQDEKGMIKCCTAAMVMLNKLQLHCCRTAAIKQINIGFRNKKMENGAGAFINVL